MDVRDVLNAIYPYVLGWVVRNGVWTPGYTGFSVNPTPSEAFYVALPGMCYIHLRHSAAGTSNAASFTITGLPFAVRQGTNPNYHAAYAIDNGVPLTGPARVAPQGTQITMLKDAGTGAWTAANAKSADLDFWYPID